MDSIIEPNESFDFTNLSLAHPSGIQGGAYFTKFLYNKNPYKEKIKIGKYDTIDTLITKLKTFLLLEVSEQNKSKAKEYIQNLVHIKSLNNN